MSLLHFLNQNLRMGQHGYTWGQATAQKAPAGAILTLHQLSGCLKALYACVHVRVVAKLVDNINT